MTITIPTIVEGQGDVSALPILLRRLGQLYCPNHHLEIPTPHRLARGKITNRPDEFNRAIQLAAAKGKSSSSAFIIVLLDSDDDCPAELGPRLVSEAQVARSDFLVTVSIAVMEFESWIIASASTLAGIHGLASDLQAPSNPEEIRNAKGWIKKHRFENTYSETIDQAKLTAQIDLEISRQNSPSFNRFCAKFEAMVLKLTATHEATE